MPGEAEPVPDDSEDDFDMTDPQEAGSTTAEEVAAAPTNQEEEGDEEGDDDDETAQQMYMRRARSTESVVTCDLLPRSPRSPRSPVSPKAQRYYDEAMADPLAGRCLSAASHSRCTALH